MSKNHFIYGYYGNKRSEYKYIKDHLPDLTNIKYIIEPFVGTAAISYQLSKEYPGKFKYILNDNDTNLYKIYEMLKNKTQRKLINNKVNDEMKKIKNKNDYLNINDEFIKYIIHRKYYNIRPGLYPINKNKPENYDFEKLPIVNFLESEDIEIYNMDALDIIEKYKNLDGVLLILDPPYIETCNETYGTAKLNIYEWLSQNNINNSNNKYLIILEDNWIIRLLFPNNIKSSYGKLYQPTKNKTNHLIINNY